MTHMVLDFMRAARVIPIINFFSLDENLRAVDSVVAGGAGVVEVVLRSPHAAETIRQCKHRHPSVRFAAGTVVDGLSYKLARQTGACMAISPGLSPELAVYAGDELPLVPGATTASEVMAARQAGFRLLKFFPAEAQNALVVLGELAPVFPDVAFMPTGKITLELLPRYFNLRNVACVGGTWMFVRDGERLDCSRTCERMAMSLKEAGA